MPSPTPRAPISDPKPEDIEDEDQVRNCIHQIMSTAAIEIDDTEGENRLSDPTLQAIRETAQADSGYQQLIKYITDGFPRTSAAMDPACRPF